MIRFIIGTLVVFGLMLWALQPGGDFYDTMETQTTLENEAWLIMATE